MLKEADILGLIEEEQFHVFPGTTTTVCALKLTNGFVVTGESACINPADFDAEMGQKIARENAIQAIWKVEGYRQKQAFYEAEQHDIA